MNANASGPASEPSAVRIVDVWRAAVAVLAIVMQAQPAQAQGALPQSGSYEITARLELPHLERWAVDKIATVCLPSFPLDGELPIPIVSANNPFAKCSAVNVIAKIPKLEYDIVCPGRGTAKGHAVYAVSFDGFSGRVAMVLGGKNMTMTEMQEARRIGECGAKAVGSAARF
jgi:hypothetical protein